MSLDVPEIGILVDLVGLEPSPPVRRTPWVDLGLNRAFSGRSIWLAPILLIQLVLTAHLAPGLRGLSAMTVIALAATVLVYFASRILLGQGAAVIAAAAFAASPVTLVAGHGGAIGYSGRHLALLVAATAVAAPIAGIIGTALVRRGRLLGIRGPIAIISLVVGLSWGVSTATSLVHRTSPSGTDTVATRVK